MPARHIALTLAACTVLAIGVSLAIEREDGGWVAPSEREELTEDTVRELRRQAEDDLRRYFVALRAYRIDFGLYPESQRLLTTPIAYLRSIPNDPFVPYAYRPVDPENGEAKPWPGDGAYTMRFAPDYSELRVYSIGPDGRDREGAVTYDPTNGIMSAGDITHNIRLENYRELMETTPDPEEYPVYAPRWQPSLMHLTNDQEFYLEGAEQVVRFWAIHHRRMPESWDDISGTIDDFVPPKDVFAEDEATVRYVLRDSVGIVYSIGPNQRDDGGHGIDGGQDPRQVFDPNYLEGDMVRTVPWEEVREQIERTEDAEALAREDPYSALLVALREETGRDNALIYYQKAALLSPNNPEGEMQRHIRRLLGDGQWTTESAMVRAYLWAWEPAFEQIRKGVSLDHADSLDPSTLDEDSPLPDVLPLQRAARALVAQGKLHESRGEGDRALDSYLTAIHMGRDLGSRNASYLTALLSAALQSIGQSALRPLVASGQLDDEQLRRTQSFLLGVEEMHLGLVEAIRGESTWVGINADRMVAALEQRTEEELRTAEGLLGRLRAIGGLGDRAAAREHLRIHKEEMTAYFHAALETLSLEPYHYDFEEFEESMNDRVRRFQSLMSEIMVRPRMFVVHVNEWVMIAHRRLLLTQIALERHKLQHGGYPESLEELRGAFVDELPTDPFSGEPFRYRVTDGGDGYTMYSLGPDKQDNPDAGKYDSRDGTFSAGVIY